MTYTATKAQAGRGTTIAVGASPTVVGECDNFPMDRNKWVTADATNFQSGSDSESIATIREGAAFTITGNRVSTDAGQVLVEAAYQAGTPLQFTVTMQEESGETTNGDKCVFNALVLGSSWKITPKDSVKFSIDLKVTGAIAYTQGS